MAICPVCGTASAGKRITYNNFDVYDLCMKCASYSVCLISPNVELVVKENAIRWAEGAIQSNANKMYLANCIRSWKKCAEDYVAAHRPVNFVQPAPSTGVLDISSTEIDLDATIKSFVTGNYSAIMYEDGKTSVDSSLFETNGGNLFSGNPTDVISYSPVQSPAPAPSFKAPDTVHTEDFAPIPTPVYRAPAPSQNEQFYSAPTTVKAPAEEPVPAPVQAPVKAPAPFPTPAPFSAPVPFTAPYTAPVDNAAAPDNAGEADRTRFYVPDTVPEPIAPAPVAVPVANEFLPVAPAVNIPAEEVTPPEENVIEQVNGSDKIELFIDDTPAAEKKPFAQFGEETLALSEALVIEGAGLSAEESPSDEKESTTKEYSPMTDEEIGAEAIAFYEEAKKNFIDDGPDVKDYLREIASTLKAINEKMDRIEKELSELKK